MGDPEVATRITIKGQVTIPKPVRDALQLRAGDGVEFEANGQGEFMVRKAPGAQTPARKRAPRAPVNRRAAELLALLRGLD
jgi:antitoxin PrlF